MPTPVVKPKVQYFIQPLHAIHNNSQATEWLNSPAGGGWRLHSIVSRGVDQVAIWEMEIVDDDAEVKTDPRDAVVAAAQRVFFGIDEDALVGQPGSNNILTALHDLGKALIELEKNEHAS